MLFPCVWSDVLIPTLIIGLLFTCSFQVSQSRSTSRCSHSCSHMRSGRKVDRHLWMSGARNCHEFFQGAPCLKPEPGPWCVRPLMRDAFHVIPGQVITLDNRSHHLRSIFSKQGTTPQAVATGTFVWKGLDIVFTVWAEEACSNHLSWKEAICRSITFFPDATWQTILCSSLAYNTTPLGSSIPPTSYLTYITNFPILLLYTDLVRLLHATHKQPCWVDVPEGQHTLWFKRCTTTIFEIINIE